MAVDCKYLRHCKQWSAMGYEFATMVHDFKFSNATSRLELSSTSTKLIFEYGGTKCCQFVIPGALMIIFEISRMINY